MKHALLLIPLLLLPATFAATPKEPHCRASDYTGGAGGQDVSCAFTCEQYNLVHLKVVALDEDASVTGEADCGTAHPDCSGDKECGATKKTNSAGAGSCAGHSAEAFDSGLKVECSAEELTEDPEVPDPPCLPVICKTWGHDFKETCDRVQRAAVFATSSLPVGWPSWTTPAGTNECHALAPPHSVVVIEMWRGMSRAAVCDAVACVEVMPACSVDANGWSCRVS